MTQQPQAPQIQEIKIYFPNELKGGVYSNLMQVLHTREEFIMNFFMVSPPDGVAVARVIMSPGHMKRTILALQDNLKKYEGNFGSIKEAPEPIEKGKLGFQMP